jgi:hypothetical protein
MTARETPIPNQPLFSRTKKPKSLFEDLRWLALHRDVHPVIRAQALINAAKIVGQAPNFALDSKQLYVEGIRLSLKAARTKEKVLSQNLKTKLTKGLQSLVPNFTSIPKH